MVKRTLILIITLALFLGTSSSFGAYEWVLLDGELNIPRHGLTGEALNGYVYAIGGVVMPGSPSDARNTVSKYDPATDSWSLVTSVPTARHSLSSAVIDGWIYAVGGHVANSRSENQRFNGTSWESKASVYARSGPGVAAYDGELYVFGGNHYSTILSRFDIYKPTTNTWRFGGDMPSATEPWRATTLGNKIYVNVGGGNKKIWCYDPVANTWNTSIPDMNVSRSGYELQAVNGRIYVIGGSGSSGAIASVESWAPGETVWRIEPSLNVARVQFASAVIGNDIYIFGGHNGGDLGSTEVLTLSEPPGPPTADAGRDQTVEQESYDGTEVTLDGSGSTDPDSTPGTNDDIVSFEWYEATTHLGSGETIDYIFQLGKHTVTLMVTDSSGEKDEDEVIIVVEDTTEPTVNSISASPDVLWPPNHKMVEVVVELDAKDICDPVPFCWILGVSSNEPINGPGDGNTEPDWEYTDDPLVVLLRAERTGGSTRRVYTIHIECMDASNNIASEIVEVIVPHDQGKGKGKK